MVSGTPSGFLSGSSLDIFFASFLQAGGKSDRHLTTGCSTITAVPETIESVAFQDPSIFEIIFQAFLGEWENIFCGIMDNQTLGVSVNLGNLPALLEKFESRFEAVEGSQSSILLAVSMFQLVVGYDGS